MQKPNKISYDEFVKTITMFWIDRDVEKTISNEVKQSTEKLANKLIGIDTPEGIEKYIREDSDSLSNILTLLDVSEEKFKRIVSMLRKERRYVFSSEWSLDKTRKALLEDKKLMNDICELFINGAVSERFIRKIPDFYRENFRIDSSTLARLHNQDELMRVIKGRYEVKYNSSITAAINHRVEDVVKLECNLEGLTYERNKYVSDIGKSFLYVIPSDSSAKIVVDCSYNITTSSTQSKFADKIKEVRKQINNNGLDCVVVNVLEGAGWIGRQSDLKVIYDNSDYVLNMTNVSLLGHVIKYKMEE